MIVTKLSISPVKKAIKLEKHARELSLDRLKGRIRPHPRTAGTIKKVLTERVRAFVLLTEREGHYRHSTCVKGCVDERKNLHPARVKEYGPYRLEVSFHFLAP